MPEMMSLWALGAAQLQAELRSYTELERTLDLAADDRLVSLLIITQLNGFVEYHQPTITYHGQNKAA